MKYCFYSLLYAGLAFAQSKITEFVPDLNGRSVAAAAYTAKDGDRTELNQSINGRPVPLQASETRILSDGPQGRTAETVVRKYDATGKLASTERTVVETQKRFKESGLSDEEAIMAAFEENAHDAALFGSGMAAATAIVLALPQGAHIVASQVMYWAFRNWLASDATRFGYRVTFADTTDLAAVRMVQGIDQRIRDRPQHPRGHHLTRLPKASVD